jgi:hypothetical protein
MCDDECTFPVWQMLDLKRPMLSEHGIFFPQLEVSSLRPSQFSRIRIAKKCVVVALDIF